MENNHDIFVEPKYLYENDYISREMVRKLNPEKNEIRTKSVKGFRYYHLGDVIKYYADKKDRYDINKMFGKKYGMLTVLKRAEMPSHVKNIYLECQCDCGNTKTIRVSSIRHGHTTTCGRKECTEKRRKRLSWY